LYSFGDANNEITSKISKTKIKIGENILLEIKVQNLNNVKILWEEMNTTSMDVEISAKKDYFKNNSLILQIEFSSYTIGIIKDLSFTIPMTTKDGKVLYLTSDKYDITVLNPLTEDEIDKIKNTKDLSKIELKKEKEQAAMPYKIPYYILIILIILGFSLIGCILYFFIYKKMMKEKKSDEKNKLPPYEEFLANIARIEFNKDDDRLSIELKLSNLTEILKTLIYEEFSFNAKAETTYELIINLKNIKFKNELIADINRILTEIDMIKFAKANVDFEKLNDYIRNISNLGFEIHSYKVSLLEKVNIENQMESIK
jgi:hypothetical protein